MQPVEKSFWLKIFFLNQLSLPQHNSLVHSDGRQEINHNVCTTHTNNRAKKTTTHPTLHKISSLSLISIAIIKTFFPSSPFPIFSLDECIYLTYCTGVNYRWSLFPLPRPETIVLLFLLHNKLSWLFRNCTALSEGGGGVALVPVNIFDVMTVVMMKFTFKARWKGKAKYKNDVQTKYTRTLLNVKLVLLFQKLKQCSVWQSFLLQLVIIVNKKDEWWKHSID